MLIAVLLPFLVGLFLLAMERFEAWVFREPPTAPGPHPVGPHPAAVADSRATNAANSSRTEGTFGHSVRV